ncbi:MAG: zinc-binding dehydrogenase [Bacillota bacterium]
MAKMRAAVQVATRKIEIWEIDRPVPRTGEILVQVKACSLCTWEQRSYLGIQHAQLPFSGGHELSGVVVEKGPGTRTDIAIGDHVVLSPRACGYCYYCLRGEDARCPEAYKVMRHPKITGPLGLAEYLLVEHREVIQVASSLPFAEASLTEPLACAVSAAMKVATRLADDVVVIGAGTMGLINVFVQKLLGARVIVSEIDEARCEKARAAGAHEVINAGSTDPVAAVKELTGGRGADVVVVSIGLQKANEQAMAMLSKSGKLMLFASAHPAVPIELDPNRVHREALVITGTTSKHRSDFQKAARILSHGLISVKPLLEAQFPLDQITEAFELSVRPDTYRVTVTF